MHSDEYTESYEEGNVLDDVLEKVLINVTVEKDFMLFFQKWYWLEVTDFRIILRDKTSKTCNQVDTEEKRTIPYGWLKGITKSTIPNGMAFVLHVKMENDELFYCAE